jgi:hypothetical protein
MFEQMVIAKGPEAIGRYYDLDFVMYSDGLSQNFAEFEASHRGVYATPISYAITYDDEAWVETDDRVAARVWETTWPSWRSVDAFADY